MNQPNQVSVSNARAGEIFQGKAAAAIKDLMVENATLSAIIEAQQEQLIKMSEELNLLQGSPGVSAPPQGYDDVTRGRSQG